jgi:hypothetical protein
MDHGIARCKERLGGLLKYYERGAALSLRSGKLPSLEAEMIFFTIVCCRSTRKRSST